MKDNNQNLSKEEKEKKRQHGRECYKSLSEDENSFRLVEYRKKCYKMRKNCLIIIIRKSFNLENFTSL